MKASFRRLLLAGSALAVIALTGCATKDAPMAVKEVGSFH